MSKLNAIQGHFIRAGDLALVQVRQKNVSVGTLQFKLEEGNDGRVLLGSFNLHDANQNQVTWKNGTETIIWTRIEPEHAIQLAGLLQGLVTGNPVPLKESIKKPEHDFESTTAIAMRQMNMMLPSLCSTDSLPSHFKQIQDIGIRSKILKQVNDKIQIKEEYKYDFVIKVQQSLTKIPEVEECYTRNLACTAYDYQELKDILLRTFCSKPAIKSLIKRLLTELNFTSVMNVERFLSDASKIIGLTTDTFGTDNLHYCTAVQNIVDKLPTWLERSVKRKIHAMKESDEEWTMAVPFNTSTSICLRSAHTTTVVEMIREECELFYDLSHSARNEITTLSTKAHPVRFPQPQVPTPRIQLTQAPPEQKDELHKRCKSVYYVGIYNNKGTSEPISELKRAGYTEIQERNDRLGRAYLLVGSDNSAEKTESDFTQMTSIRTFSLSKMSNF